MREYVVKVLAQDGRTLRRFVTFASSFKGALSKGYEAADQMPAAADVVVVEV